MVTKYQQDIAVVNESSVLPGNGWTWDDINPEARLYVHGNGIPVPPVIRNQCYSQTFAFIFFEDGLREPVIC